MDQNLCEIFPVTCWKTKAVLKEKGGPNQCELGVPNKVVRECMHAWVKPSELQTLYICSVFQMKVKMTVGMTMMMTMNGMTDLAVLVFCEFSTCLSSDVCFNPMNYYTVTCDDLLQIC